MDASQPSLQLVRDLDSSPMGQFRELDDTHTNHGCFEQPTTSLVTVDLVNGSCRQPDVEGSPDVQFGLNFDTAIVLFNDFPHDI